MLEAVQDAVLRFLRVPPEPQPPAGAAGSVQVFRAARNFLFYHLFQWALKQVSTLTGILVGLYVFAQGWMDYVQFGPFSGEAWFWVLEVVGIGTFVLQLPVTMAGVILDYRMRWYIVTDRSLRIREGIWKVREKTMSLANVQNLGVQQGPLQRLLGISDLEVKTAGGGEVKSSEAQKSGESLHTGYFHGVDNAEEIKGLVLARLRRLRDSGLGDPDEERGPAPAPSAAGEAPTPAAVLRHACEELLSAARGLRSAAGP